MSAIDEAKSTIKFATHSSQVSSLLRQVIAVKMKEFNTIDLRKARCNEFEGLDPKFDRIRR